MRHRARTSVGRIGGEAQPIVVLDDFAPDPDALREAAAVAGFASAGEHYPGIRARLPDAYLSLQLPVIAAAIGRAFGRVRRVRIVDASFSIVTCPADALSLAQRLPHVDAYGADRIALVHYLSPGNGDGTAFFRHRSTGFETIDDARAPDYTLRLKDELAAAGEPHGYIAGDTPLFTRTALIDARYNRALVYRSYMLHSGAIQSDAALTPDPREGRLTVTGFFAVE